MSQTVSPSTSRCYGLARVGARVECFARRGVSLSQGNAIACDARRRGPTGPCPDAELADHIRREIEASDSRRRLSQNMGATADCRGSLEPSPRAPGDGRERLVRPHRVGRNQERTHDGTIVTDKVNEMWGTDMSQTVTLEEGRAYVFVAVEHANSEIVGIHAARSANRFEALEPVRQGVHRCFGSIAPGVACGLTASRSWLQLHVRRFPGEIKCLASLRLLLPHSPDLHPT